MKFAKILLLVVLSSVIMPTYAAGPSDQIATTHPVAGEDMIGWLGDPGTWNDTIICIASAKDASDLGGKVVHGFVKLRVQECFTNEHAPSDLVVPTWLLQQISNRQTLPKKVISGEVLVLSIPTKGQQPLPIYTVVLEESDRESTIHSLKLIQDYRKETGDKKSKLVEQMLTSGNDLTLQYICQVLLTTRQTLSEQQRALLLKARDNELLNPTSRLLASETLSGCDARYRDKREHAHWVLQWFGKPKQITSGICDRFLSQMTKYGDPREFESVVLPALDKALALNEANVDITECISRWLAMSVADNGVNVKVEDTIITMMLKRGFACNNGDLGVIYLRNASLGMRMWLSRLTVDKKMTQEDVGKYLESLSRYQKMISENTKTAKNDKLRAAGISVQSFIPWLIQNAPKAPTSKSAERAS